MEEACTDATSAVDSGRHLPTWWSLLRPIAGLLYPSCFAACDRYLSFIRRQSQPSNPAVTFTIICPTRHTASKVRLCLQQHPAASPTFLLHLPFHTSDFAAELARGLTRISLESSRNADLRQPQPPLLSADTFAVYCGGRRVGYAARQSVTGEDAWLLETMRTVTAGAGSAPAKDGEDSGGFKYFRGRFERVVGSEDAESYYLIEPSGSAGQQDLSIFFTRV